MIKANIEAEIEAVKKKKDQNYEEIKKLDKIMEANKRMQKKLLEKDSDYNFRLSELEEQLNELQNTY